MTADQALRAAHRLSVREVAALSAAPTPPPAIYVQLNEDGQHIRKWSREPFEEGEAYAALVQEPTHD